MRDKLESERDPFEQKLGPKTLVPRSLQYLEEESPDAAYLEFRPPRRQNAKDEEQHEQLKDVRYLLTHAK